MDMDCGVCGQTTVTPVIDAVLYRDVMYHGACWDLVKAKAQAAQAAQAAQDGGDDDALHQ